MPQGPKQLGSGLIQPRYQSCERGVLGSGLETQTDLIPKGGLGIRPGANTGLMYAEGEIISELGWRELVTLENE